MIVKSVIAGTVLSLMAGGIVYFGTDIDAGELKDKVVTKTAEVKADISDKTSKEMAQPIFEIRKV